MAQFFADRWDGLLFLVLVLFALWLAWAWYRAGRESMAREIAERQASSAPYFIDYDTFEPVSGLDDEWLADEIRAGNVRIEEAKPGPDHKAEAWIIEYFDGNH